MTRTPWRVRTWCTNSRTVGFGSCAATMCTGRPSVASMRAPASHEPKLPVGTTSPRSSASARRKISAPGMSRVSGRGRGPHCSMLSVSERASDANTR